MTSRLISVSFIICVLNAQTITITGTVNDRLENPVEDVTVSYLCDGNELITPVQTDSNGHFEFSFELLDILENTLPNSISLGANYPNPFNPGTVIPLTTNQPGQFFIYNLLGREIQSLTIHRAGDYRISWGGKLKSGLPAPAGIYFYSFQTNEKRSTGKMILMDGGGNTGLSISGKGRPITEQIVYRRDECENYSITFSANHITDIEIDLGENGYMENTNVEQEVNMGPYWICETEYSIEVDSVLMIDLGECFYNDDETVYSIIEPEEIYIINDSLFIEVNDIIGFTVNVEGIDSDDIELIENVSININGGQVQTPEWEFYGLDSLFITQLKVYQNYLYAGTFNMGFWRIDIMADSSEWEYMGLSSIELNYEFYMITDFIQSEYNSNETIVTGMTFEGELPGVYKTTDNGENWDPSNNGLDYYLPQYNFTGYSHPNKFQHIDSTVFSWGEKYFLTNDFGDSWLEDTSAYDQMGYTGPINMIYDFKKHDISDLHFWVGGESMYFAPVLLRTNDGGTTWDNIILNLSDDGVVMSIALHPNDTDIIYIALWSGWIIKATDGGAGWIESWPDNPITPIFIHPINNQPFRSILIDVANPAHLFCAGGAYLFETYDGGENWLELITPIENENGIKTMLYDGENERLFVGTEAGVFLLTQ